MGKERHQLALFTSNDGSFFHLLASRTCVAASPNYRVLKIEPLRPLTLLALHSLPRSRADARLPRRRRVAAFRLPNRFTFDSCCKLPISFTQTSSNLLRFVGRPAELSTMPLNGDSRRIYPDPAPLRDRSPIHRNPGSVTQQATGSQPRTTMPALTPGPFHQKEGPRSFYGYPSDFDGLSNQSGRLATTLGQPGPARAGSQSRKLNTATPSRVKTERSDAAAERAAVAAGVRMEVPNTLPTPRAPPMKHQTSQSTDSSVQERGRGQSGNLRSGYMGSDRQTLFGSVISPFYLGTIVLTSCRQAKTPSMKSVTTLLSLLMEFGLTTTERMSKVIQRNLQPYFEASL